MKRAGYFGLMWATLLATAVAVQADNATMHGSNFKHQGSAIQMTNFDVTLDGRLLTADRGVYHPDTGVVELSGNVKLKFGPHARTDATIR